MDVDRGTEPLSGHRDGGAACDGVAEITATARAQQEEAR